MLSYAYLIRWDHFVTYGDAYVDAFKDRYSFLEELKCANHARGCLFTYSQDSAIEFGSWAEAAAVAAFIIHHLDDKYEDALDVVMVNL